MAVGQPDRGWPFRGLWHFEHCGALRKFLGAIIEGRVSTVLGDIAFKFKFILSMKEIAEVTVESRVKFDG